MSQVVKVIIPIESSFAITERRELDFTSDFLQGQPELYLKEY